MKQTGLSFDELTGQQGRDNITDWALQVFQNRYKFKVSKDDIWNYIYGIMHAPDWREKYKYDLQRELPRIPLANDFKAFSRGG